MSKINLTIQSTKPLTEAEVRNLVRKAFSGDKPLTVGTTGEFGALKFSVSDIAKTLLPTEAGTIRAWARAQGLPVGKRGRIHPDVKAAYAKKH